MRVWIFQDDHQVKKHGAAKASWYVGWIDPDGKRRCQSCGAGGWGKSQSEKLRKKIEAELRTGTYQSPKKKTWDEFRKEYEDRIVSGMEPQTRWVTLDSIKHFERLIDPKRIGTIKTQTIDDYISARRKEPGRRRGDTVSPATVNKELRHLRAALRVAAEWGYLLPVPKFRMIREPWRLPTYVPPEHFAKIYAACKHAKKPAGQSYSAEKWWQALLMTAS
jgi:integrase